jgi:hypothetical protein
MVRLPGDRSQLNELLSPLPDLSPTFGDWKKMGSLALHRRAGETLLFRALTKPCISAALRPKTLAQHVE